ncbi:MAG: type III-B CRISPR module-associated protein Cmr3 [Candidatus Asgardarchaeia archaeon]
MKKLILNPLDVILFRTPRPFAARESFFAESETLNQMTVAGAVRALIYLNNPKESMEMIGYGKECGDLKFRGSYFYSFKRNSELFPLPRDLVKDKYEERRKMQNNKLFILYPRNIFEEDLGERTIPLTQFLHVEYPGKYITKENLMRYLNGEIPEIYQEKIYIYERRIGIKMSDTRVTQRGFIYNVNFLRLTKDHGISVWLYDDELTDEEKKILERIQERSINAVRVGGENRGAYYEFVDFDGISVDKNLLDRIGRDKRLKVYIATPAIFKDGYKPDREMLQDALGGNVELELVAYCIGKPKYIGGWDIVKKSPKKLYRFVPEGSVFYYKIKDGEIKVENLPIMVSDKYKDLGFGAAFIGRWYKCM